MAAICFNSCCCCCGDAVANCWISCCCCGVAPAATACSSCGAPPPARSCIAPPPTPTPATAFGCSKSCCIAAPAAAWLITLSPREMFCIRLSASAGSPPSPGTISVPSPPPPAAAAPAWLSMTTVPWTCPAELATLKVPSCAWTTTDPGGSTAGGPRPSGGIRMMLPSGARLTATPAGKTASPCWRRADTRPGGVRYGRLILDWRFCKMKEGEKTDK